VSEYEIRLKELEVTESELFNIIIGIRSPEELLAV